jgi:hypothetical protein
MTGWRSIETAPKDGTLILAFSPKAEWRQRIQVTWWRRAEDNRGYIGWGELRLLAANPLDAASRPPPFRARGVT